LLADLVGHANFPDDEIEKTRRQVMGLLGMASGSTYQACRALFHHALFGDGPYAQPVMGSQRTVAQFTRDDLLNHRATLYAPENMILTCVTNLNTDDAFAILDATFGRLPAGTPPSGDLIVPPSPPVGMQTAHEPMDKEQIYIYRGGLLPGASHPDAPAIMVANEILSRRLAAELREQRGLAYSVGASFCFDRDFGWQMSTMGTGKDNFVEARNGIAGEIARLREEPVTAEELEIAQNTLWGSSLTRRLSRVNQAYYMALSEYLGRGYDYDDRTADLVQAVTVEDVRRVAQTYFDTENCVMTTVGDLE